MSKSKGNAMDPLELIDKYGADALRFTLAAMAAQGRDIKLSEQRIEGYRNFGTKLWNAARFAQMNECAVWDKYDPRSPRETVNKWIVGETAKAAAAVTRELEARRFNEAAGALYKFVWNVYCDWYLEFIKPLLNGEDEAAKLETRRTAAWALDQILILLHPFMPFITEEIWARTGEYGQKRAGMLITETWPQLSADLIDDAAEAEIDWMVKLIAETRSTRSELNVPAGAKIPLLLLGADAATEARLERYQDLIDRMARLEYSTSAAQAPKGSVTFVLDGATVALPLEGVVDLPAEAARLDKGNRQARCRDQEDGSQARQCRFRRQGAGRSGGRIARAAGKRNRRASETRARAGADQGVTGMAAEGDAVGLMIQTEILSLSVIPGRRAATNPEPRGNRCDCDPWVPDRASRVRNDGVRGSKVKGRHSRRQP